MSNRRSALVTGLTSFVPLALGVADATGEQGAGWNIWLTLAVVGFLATVVILVWPSTNKGSGGTASTVTVTDSTTRDVVGRDKITYNQPPPASSADHIDVTVTAQKSLGHTSSLYQGFKYTIITVPDLRIDRASLSGIWTIATVVIPTPPQMTYTSADRDRQPAVPDTH